MQKTALILGSTGLVGSSLLEKVLNHPSYSTVITVVRKPQHINHPKLNEIITDFNSDIDLSFFDKIDSIFSCLGTTRKKTPDLNVYRKIEIDIPLSFIKKLNQKNDSKFHFISAIGADSTSSNFYLKMKGEAENELIQNNQNKLFIYRPSILIGGRTEFRFGEKIATIIFPVIDLFLLNNLSKYKSMQVNNLSQAMINKDVEQSSSQVEYLYYNEIMKTLKS
jgi:nucleoside-diphosphate-sugar epimerase